MKVYERIYQERTAFYNVRVWCAVDGPNDTSPEKVVFETVKKLAYASQEEVAEVVAKLPFCNAVEVLNYNTGNGLLIYPDWP